MRKVTALVLASLMLANCATAPGEDDGISWGWIVAGVAVVAVVALVVAVNNTPDIGYKCPPGGCISDERLKRNIIYFDTLPNGLKLYSFRYWNDDRSFVGVMAQDLMEDERFSHAVVEDDSGYYRVDFAALALGVTGDAEQFLEAGEAAVAAVRPVIE